MEFCGVGGKQPIMIIIASNNKMILHLFLVFVIFIFGLIALRSKIKSISFILTYIPLTNIFLNAKVTFPTVNSCNPHLQFSDTSNPLN
jgi:hypothetical protein